jgi:hypothetical protein
MNNDGLPSLTHKTVLRPMGLLITASCETAQDQTAVWSEASSTEMQCLTRLRHSGAFIK